MKRSSTRHVTSRVCSVVLALVFAVAAVPKLIDPGTLAADIENYRVLPENLIGLAALFMPAFELVIALALLWPRYQRGAALLATGLLVVFAGAMAQARMRGIDLSCGCFGAAFESKVSWLTVARSLLLAALGVMAATWPALPPADHTTLTPQNRGLS